MFWSSLQRLTSLLEFSFQCSSAHPPPNLYSMNFSEYFCFREVITTDKLIISQLHKTCSNKTMYTICSFKNKLHSKFSSQFWLHLNWSISNTGHLDHFIFETLSSTGFLDITSPRFLAHNLSFPAWAPLPSLLWLIPWMLEHPMGFDSILFHALP